MQVARRAARSTSRGTLAQKIARGPIRATAAIKLAARLADALAYSHAQGVVHRDFKPSNVLFTADDNPVLADFGIARPADSYSFGLTLLEMLTGRLPEVTNRALRGANDGKEIRAVLAPISPGVADLVCQCLQSDPAARPSASECARQLKTRTRANVIVLLQGSSSDHCGNAKDVFKVQDPIAGAVVSALKLKLAPGQQALSSQRTSNPEAYTQYLLGRQFHERQNVDGFRRAVEAYRRANSTPITPPPMWGLPYRSSSSRIRLAKRL